MHAGSIRNASTGHRVCRRREIAHTGLPSTTAPSNRPGSTIRYVSTDNHVAPYDMSVPRIT
eukprot:1433029-Rhodomonas_salina.1